MKSADPLSQYQLQSLLNKIIIAYHSLNQFPTDLLQGQCEIIIGVYVKPSAKNRRSRFP
jgi:hypothetical protein